MFVLGQSGIEAATLLHDFPLKAQLETVLLTILTVRDHSHMIVKLRVEVGQCLAFAVRRRLSVSERFCDGHTRVLACFEENLFCRRRHMRTVVYEHFQARREIRRKAIRVYEWTQRDGKTEIAADEFCFDFVFGVELIAVAPL